VNASEVVIQVSITNSDFHLSERTPRIDAGENYTFKFSFKTTANEHIISVIAYVPSIDYGIFGFHNEYQWEKNEMRYHLSNPSGSWLSLNTEALCLNVYVFLFSLSVFIALVVILFLPRLKKDRPPQGPKDGSAMAPPLKGKD